MSAIDNLSDCEKQKMERLEKKKRANKEWYKKLRVDILSAYGNKCACCGISEKEFLSLDHVNGGGRKHTAKRGRYEAYRDAKRRNYPTDYRLLCHNCNFAIGIFGACPHERNQK